MESINRVELQGYVEDSRITDISGTQVARISLRTEFFYKGETLGAVVETMWHSIVAWAGEGRDLSIIKKGQPIKVTGRLRSLSYTDREGNRRESIEILSQKLERV